jgi:GTP-binding protein Era
MTTTKCGIVALAGQPNAGKSSLLNALVGQPLAMVSAKAQATRLPTVGLRTERQTQLVLYDLPGLLDPGYLLQRRMAESAAEVLGAADVIVLLHPAGEEGEPSADALAAAGARRSTPVIRCWTKIDVGSPAGPVPDGVVAVSARTGAGLELLVAAIEPLVPEGPWRFPEDDVGTQPLRFFVSEYLREAAFELLSDEVPYALTAVVEEFREGADPVYIRAEVFVERESQKKIVIGADGRTIKAIGRHARLRLEALLGARVYLETRVKVEPRWRQSPDLLSRFGYPASLAGERR